jgi:hypothetical protein
VLSLKATACQTEVSNKMIIYSRTCRTARAVNSNPLTAKTIVCFAGKGSAMHHYEPGYCIFCEALSTQLKGKPAQDHFINITDRF